MPRPLFPAPRGSSTHPGHPDRVIVATIERMLLTAFGAAAVTLMMVMYALERRHNGFVLAFACGCLLSSVYGFLAGAWPFGVVELVWAGVAARRFLEVRARLGSVAPR